MAKLIGADLDEAHDWRYHSWPDANEEVSEMLTTEQVAEFFVGRADGLGEDCLFFPPTWAPAARDSFAVETIGGDIGERVAITRDDRWENNRYWWYDLGMTHKGGIVYRVSCHGTIHKFFQEGAFWRKETIRRQ